MTPEAQRLLDAYRAAWDVRDRTGRTDADLLFEMLAEHGLESQWTENPTGRSLLTTKWDAGVPPGRLRLSLLHELPRLMYHGTVTPLLAVRRAFKGD